MKTKNYWKETRLYVYVCVCVKLCAQTQYCLNKLKQKWNLKERNSTNLIWNVAGLCIYQALNSISRLEKRKTINRKKKQRKKINGQDKNGE